MIATTRQLLTSALVVLAISFSSNTFAGDADLKLKSEGLALALALDPIPGDALFYAEKPIQGVINSLLGGAGGVMFWYGAIHFATHTDSSETNCVDMSCGDWSGLRDGYFMFVGGLLYFPALLWDGIGGVKGVKNYNAEISQKKHSFLTTFRPTVAVTSNGTFVGGEFRF